MDKKNNYYNNIKISHNTPFNYTSTYKYIYNACLNGNLQYIKDIYKYNTYINISKIFRNACEFGHLDIVKYTLNIKPNLNINAYNNYAFRYACYNGHLHILQFILKISPQINIHMNNEEPFRYAASKGYLHIIQYLMDYSNNSININAYKNEALCKAAANGHLNIIQYLLILQPHLNIHINNEEPMRNACSNGHINIVKFLFEQNKNIYFHANNEEILRSICNNGHLHILKYLVSINIKFYIHIKDEEPFINAIRNGHVDIAKYLWEYSNQTIDFTINNHTAYSSACVNNQINSVKFLCSLCDYYHYDYNDTTNKIIYWNILDEIAVYYKQKHYSKIFDKLNCINQSFNQVDAFCNICINTWSEVDYAINFDCQHKLCIHCYMKFYHLNDNEYNCYYCRTPIDNSKITYMNVK